MSLRLVRPPGEGQAFRPPRRRKDVLSLTPDERRNLRQALKNLRLRFGSWSCLAEVMDVPVQSLTAASSSRPGFGSYGLALRAARAAGSTIEAVLSGKLTPGRKVRHLRAWLSPPPLR
jgi:hypothetical protein